MTWDDLGIGWDACCAVWCDAARDEAKRGEERKKQADEKQKEKKDGGPGARACLGVDAEMALLRLKNPGQGESFYLEDFGP